MSTKKPFVLRAFAIGGTAVLALGVSTGVAAAQTGSLESGFGLDVESVLSPAGEIFPDPGSLDEAVSSANAGSEAGSSDARGEAQRALPPPSGSGAAGGDPAGGAPAVSGSAGGGVMGIPGAGSLEPIQSGLGAGDSTEPGTPTPGALGAGTGAVDRPGAGADTALTALLTMTGGQGEVGTGSAELPPLPPLR